MLLPRATGETVRSDLDWFFRRDGSMFPVSYVSAPIEMPEGRGAVVAFTDIEDRLRAERVLREHDAVLAAREASLRRIAALVAGGAASAEVFAAIAREVAGVLGVSLVAVWRYESDGTGTVVGAWSEPPHLLEVGSRWPLDDTVIIARVRETGRPARSDDLADVHGTIADIVREAGIRSAAGAPIVVDGDVWGVMAAGGTEGERLPDHIEDRLAGVHGAGRHDDLEQREPARSSPGSRTSRPRCGAWRRWSPAKRPAGRGLRGGRAMRSAAPRCRRHALVRYELDGTATVVAAWSRSPEITNRSAHESHRRREHRRDRWCADRAAGADRTTTRMRPALRPHWAGELGLRSSVGAPIVVDQRLWGAMIVSSKGDRPLPADTESRIADFTELVATAISNIRSAEDLAASREDWRRRGRGSWRRPTRSAGAWFAICTTARSSAWSTRSSR